MRIISREEATRILKKYERVFEFDANSDVNIACYNDEVVLKYIAQGKEYQLNEKFNWMLEDSKQNLFERPQAKFKIIK